MEARGRNAPKAAPDVFNGFTSIALNRDFRSGNRSARRTLTESFDEGWAWATEDGEGNCSLQLVVDHARLERPLEALHEQLVERLSLIPERLGQLQPLSAVLARGIQPVLRGGLVDNRQLRVGDAAYSCDPLSGHGMYEALAGAFAAAPTINTLLRCSERSAMACSFYRQRAEALFHERLQTAREFYRSEIRWPHSAFWLLRRQLALPQLASEPLVAGLFPMAVVEDGLIVERNVVRTAEYPRGVRFVANVDLAILLNDIHRPQEEFRAEKLACQLMVPANNIRQALEWLQRSGLVRCGCDDLTSRAEPATT
ncbi:hypothetical protein D3C77_454450 [compost metagenome]